MVLSPVMHLSTVPPDPPTNVMVTSEARQLSLTWTNPFDGYSTITMVMVTYQENMAGSPLASVNITSIMSYTITGLTPNKQYNISLQSFNSVGGSDITMMMANTDPLGEFAIITSTIPLHSRHYEQVVIPKPVWIKIYFSGNIYVFFWDSQFRELSSYNRDSNSSMRDVLCLCRRTSLVILYCRPFLVYHFSVMHVHLKTSTPAYNPDT